MNEFSNSVEQATIAELRRQLQVENDKLRKELAAWPEKALNHALDAREREQAALAERSEQVETVSQYVRRKVAERKAADIERGDE